MPAEVRHFSLIQRQRVQQEVARRTGIVMACEPHACLSEGSSSEDSSSEDAAEARLQQDLRAWRAGPGMRAWDADAPQDASMEAELVAFRRSGVRQQLALQLGAMRALEAVCEAARLAVLQRLQIARAQFDAAYDAYLRQYPSVDEIRSIHADRAARGLPPLYSPQGPQRFHLDTPSVDGVCEHCVEAYVVDIEYDLQGPVPCADCVLRECQVRGATLDATITMAVSVVAVRAGLAEAREAGREVGGEFESGALESAVLKQVGLCSCCVQAGAPCDACVTRALHPWRCAELTKRQRQRVLLQQYAKWCVPAPRPASWPSEWWTHERLLEHHQRLVKALRAQDAAEHAGLLRVIDSGGKADEMRTRFDAFIGITPHEFLQCTDPYARGIALASLDYEEADQLLLIEQGQRVMHRSGCGCASQGFRDAGCRLLRARAPFRCIACTAWLI